MVTTDESAFPDVYPARDEPAARPESQPVRRAAFAQQRLFQTFRPPPEIDASKIAQSDTVLSVVFQNSERLAVVHNYIRRGVEVASG